MSRTYSEIVVEGPFMLVKGFLVGFLATKKPDGKYFFHRKAGIRRETLKGFLKEFFELDNHVHLCLENDLKDDFVEAAKLYSEITGLEIKSIKPIHSASFTFAHEFHNEEQARKAKEMLTNLPEGVETKDFHPHEEHDEEGKGVESYAPLHEYTYRAKGTITGDFEPVIELYLKIKRSEIAEAIMLGDLHLDLN